MTTSPVRRGLSGRDLAVAGVVCVLAGLATLLLLMGRPRIDTAESQRPSSVAFNNVPAPQPTSLEPTIESAPEPIWVGGRRATWRRDGSKTITFELAASNDVAVRMKRARPVLVVRCLSRTTDVFVAIGSAASIERERPGSHTVQVQFDAEAPVVQQWSDSQSSQELFAPDGVAVTRRLARARSMRFGFTPFNAAPVIAEFHVSGFDRLAGLVADTCGWRLDDARNAGKRRAVLN